MEPMMILFLLVGLIVVFLLIGAPLKPIKYIGQGCIKLLIGALLLFFLNAFGNQFGVHIPINFITSAVSGFLGIPGVLALVVIDMWVV